MYLTFYMQGGKDHASARYIFTKLAPITRYLFPKDDDNLLDYLKDDGKKIEPTWLVLLLSLSCNKINVTINLL